MTTEPTDDPKPGTPAEASMTDSRVPEKPEEYTEAERETVENETEDLRQRVTKLTGDDLKSGNWFEKLIAHALSSYTKTATYDWFQEKYQGAPADVIVDQRIEMATRYAACPRAGSKRNARRVRR